MDASENTERQSKCPYCGAVTEGFYEVCASCAAAEVDTSIVEDSVRYSRQWDERLDARGGRQ